MGQLGFLKMFLIVSIPSDVNDNRRHVHIFHKGRRRLKSVAKIWIECNGVKSLEVAYSDLSVKDEQLILSALDKHWVFINDQISNTFNGVKTKLKDLSK